MKYGHITPRRCSRCLTVGTVALEPNPVTKLRLCTACEKKNGK